MDTPVGNTNRRTGKEHSFFDGGGETGELLRATDWSKTALGPIEKWPQNLRTCIRIMLTSRQPIWIGWGKELIKLYNDPYIGIVKGKHPWAFGSPASVVWKDIWRDIEPMLQTVMEKDEGTYAESQLLIMERNGYPEETYYTFSYTPIPGDDGGTAGMICANTDDTDRIIMGRQLKTLSQLGKSLTSCHTQEDVIVHTLRSLCENARDFPFVLFYSINSDKAVLFRHAGLNDDYSQLETEIQIGESGPFARLLQKVVSDLNMQVLEGVEKAIGVMPMGDWQVRSDKAIVLPIVQSSTREIYGVLVAGLNPYRLFDEKYSNFLTLVADQVATSFADVNALEEQRKRAEALAEIDRAKTVFFSNISHEFRTPLTLMLGPVKDLLQDFPDERYREQLEVVHRNGLRLQKLVNSLLDFSRLEAGRMKASYVPTDLSSFTADLASNFRSAIEKAGLKLIVDAGQVKEPVYVDRDMWEKIVLNLLSNAFKFTFEGEIEVRLEERPEDVVLTVRDTGDGIPGKDLPQVFERFKRVEGARSRSIEGSGIGLSLVQDLVKLHGGEVSVESREHEGTTFRIIIPKGAAHLPKEHIQHRINEAGGDHVVKPYVEETGLWISASDARLDHNNGSAQDQPMPGVRGRPLVLLADDNADMRRYVYRLLSERFEVLLASDGEAALATIRSRKPDLVVTDVMMPKLDGFGLLEKLRNDPHTSATPVIMLSARAGEEARLEGIEAGADDYLVKPFHATELIARVTTLIASSRTKQETENRLYEVLMQAPAMIALLRGPDHVYELANFYYRQVVGEHRELLGKTMKEALPELASQGFNELIDEVYNSGKPYYGNETLVQLDPQGSGELKRHYFDFVYYPIKDNEKVEAILVHATDVTAKVEARNAARERERFLGIRLRQQAVVTELGLVALSDIGLKGLLQEAVSKLQKVLEVDYTKVLELLPGEKELVLRAGMGWKDGVVIDQSTVGAGTNSQAGYTLNSKEPVIVKDLSTDKRFTGPPLLVEHGVKSGMSCIIWAKNNRPYGVLGVHTTKSRDFTVDDVTFLQAVANILAAAIQRKQDEDRIQQSSEKLIASEKKFRTLADNIPNLCWMADASGWIYWYNSRWYEYTGTVPEDMEGWGWQSVHDPYVLPTVLEKWNRSISTGEVFEMVFPLKGADGQFRPFLTRVVPVRDAEGRITQWFGANTDITERENLARQKDEFMGIASHELKTPVTSIKASIQIVNRLFAEKSFDKAANFLIKAEVHIDKLTGLINDLLDVSKIQAGKLQYDFSAFKVGDIIEDVVEQISHQSKKHEIIVNGDMSAGVYGDKTRLEQVMSNLLTNAIKYSPDADKVIVNVASQKSSIRVSVTDFGIGIPEEKWPYVFDRFFRVEKTSHKFQGLGLGLYICSEIIKRHGGVINLESTEGEGTTFYFTIPAFAPGGNGQEKMKASGTYK